MVMELDERLRWIEIRVTSSLKPRAEELKRLFTNEKSRYTVMPVENYYFHLVEPVRRILAVIYLLF